MNNKEISEISKEFKYDFIKIVFTMKNFEQEIEITLTSGMIQQLNNIAQKFDDDFELILKPGDETDMYFEFPSITIRAPGDQEPYTNDEPDEDGDWGFDMMGEWDFNLKTGEVDFYVERET